MSPRLTRPTAAPYDQPTGGRHPRGPDRRREGLSPLRAGLLGCLIISGGYLLTAPPRGQRGLEAIATDAAYAEAIKGYRALSFSVLSGFEYREGMSLATLPADITSAQATKVAIHGFMLPLDVTRDGVSHFLLNGNYDMCQFGASTGAPHQWVEVVMPAGRFVPYTHLPITVLGTFTLGEHRERGRVLSLYRLAAERVLTSG